MKKLSIFILSAVVFVSNTAFAQFSDVNGKTYYKASIDWMADNGVINGYGDGKFGPDDCVKRVELLKMLFETLDLNEKGFKNEPLFSDTPANQWYADYVRAAKALKVVDGYPDGTFKPGQCVNRVEALKMSILQFNDGKIPEYGAMFGNPYDIASWEDVEDEWWYDYYNYAFSASLVGTEHFKEFNGDWSGMGVESSFANPTFNFEPDGSMSRKEVAEMLYRMKAVKDNEDSIEGYYYDELKPKTLVSKFDGCGDYEKYKNSEWIANLASKYGFGSLNEKLVEACLALDGSHFIFIAEGNHSSCGNAFSYYPSSDTLVTPNVNGYCISEFGKRVGKYVEFVSDDIEKDQECDTTHYGKYYFMDNELEYDIKTNCQYY